MESTLAFAKKDFDIGMAISCYLKKGEKVARAGWNGKNMFIYYVPEGAYAPSTEVAKDLVNEEGKVPYGAYIALKTVDGTVIPWVCSQADLLAQDWYVIE